MLQTQPNRTTASTPIPMPKTPAGGIAEEVSFNQLFEGLPTPLAVWSLDARILRANRAWETILGYTTAELQGCSAFELVHPDDRMRARAAFEELAVAGTITGFECRALCRDGGSRWILVNASRIPDPGCVYVTAEDITRRKAAEEALAESESRFRSAFSNTLVGMCIIGLDGRFLQVNESLCRITGISEAGLLNLTFFEIADPAEAADNMAVMKRLLEGGCESATLTKRHLRPGRKMGWALVQVNMVRDAEGRPLHFVVLVEDITELKAAEEALRESEEWLNFSQSAVGVGIWDWSAATGLTRASREQYRLYGLNPEQPFPAREKFLELIHPGDRKRVAQEIDSAFHPKGKYDTRYRVVLADGTVRWLSAYGRVLFNEAGEPQRFIGANKDITERVRTEMTAKEFFDLSPAPLAICDFDGRIHRANRALLDTTQLSPDQLGQTPFYEFFHPDDSKAVAAAFASVIHTGASTALEARGMLRGGGHVWLFVTIAAIPEEKLAYITAHNITDRKHTDEALRESERRFQLIAESIDEVFWMVDVKNDRIVYVSPAYERVWGLNTQALFQDRSAFHDIIHPDDRERVQNEDAEAERNGTPVDHEYRVVRPDGSLVWIWDRGAPVRNANGEVQYFVGLAQDITQRKQLEQDLQARTRKLERSNVELERFAYIASHDLQEPLRMVASFTQLLRNKYAGRLDETADRYINYAVDGAKRMQSLIADLLTYSRANSRELELRTTDCNEVVQDSLRNLAATIESAGAAVESGSLPKITADPVQLAQVFQNLISNAVKFRSEQRPHVRIGAAERKEDWLFSVRDNGIGIEPQHRERVFGIFQRLHTQQAYPGTGIGLAVCKTVVERHGGRIWVESQPGAGTTFWFTLPRVQTTAEIPKSA